MTMLSAFVTVMSERAVATVLVHDFVYDPIIPAGGQKMLSSSISFGRSELLASNVGIGRPVHPSLTSHVQYR